MLDRQDLRTRRGTRTPNLRVLSAAPLPIGPPGHGGQGRTRTGYLLFARQALYLVSYKPMEPVTRIERATPAVRRRCTTFSASPA
jgi:hypothetical protein